MPDALWEGALKIVRRLRGAGHEAYFVGGVVRDLLLGAPVKDIDIATSARPEQIQAAFERTYAIGAAFGIINVLMDGLNYEVATYREERDYLDGRHPESVSYASSPELDAQRRDFTINALFHDPVEGSTLDFTGGLSDLRRGVLRCIGDPRERFKEDHLRILRAVRFGARLGFCIDPATLAAAAELAPELRRISSERVRDELTKILTGPRPDEALETLSQIGALKVILPEVEALKGVEQPKEFHPEGDVFVHTKLMLAKLALRSEELVWTVLLHDIGKPGTFTRDEAGVPHFYCHDHVGAVMAESLLKRLRFSNKTSECVVHAVRQHMRYAAAAQMRPAKWRRLIAEPTFALELELHRLDCASSHAKLDNVIFLLDKVVEEGGKPELPPPFLTGADLVELGHRPGPLFGTILRAAADAQYGGEFPDRAAALAWVKASYPL